MFFGVVREIKMTSDWLRCIRVILLNTQRCLQNQSPSCLPVSAENFSACLVVWRSDLCQKEALRQLSDTSFYAKIQKDLTSTNQKLAKDTIQNLIVNQELPDTATNLIITTLRTLCIYFLPKFHKPNNPQSRS